VQAFVFTSASKAALVRHGQLLLERGVVLPRRELCGLADEMVLYQWLDERGDRCGAPSGSHDDHVASWLLCAKWFHSAGSGGGRVFAHGRSWSSPELDRVPEPEVEQAPTPEVTDADPEIARLKRLAAAAAARKAKEAAEHLKSIMGKHQPHGTDHEPRGGWTQRPRRSPFGFDLDIRLGD
jgi:hypothetical protein